ncbi:hypothetical protein DL771_008118 [Monosporascus sp. 5C6A]|nr:hypothetical protein DL771_008118 [Monosporascus sp. 5C6A]
MDWLRRHFDQPFSFLGLSSMAGVVLRDRLASLTGLANLPNTLVFDYPTPAAVSKYLYSRLLELETTPLPHSTPITTANSEVEPIAIISMACRYPGGISSPEDLWQLVSDEIDATTDFPDDRGWDLEALYSTNPDAPNTSTTKRGGFLPDFAHFDAGLFGMAPREALATDPQQRLLLETTWELAERGGIAPLSLQGSQTGVFVGTLYEDYEENGFGNHAAQSLRNRECTLTIAGGVTTMATPRPFTMFSRRRGLSSDGRCRAYSSEATGTGWSEGVGLILLERLSDAKRNGHQILGLIRGSAVNSDGKSNGLTAPNGPAQQMCIQSALAQAGISPASVDVLEGHGTATPLGDPIEVQAVISAYGNGYSKDNDNSTRRSIPLLLGSIKSNIGHTQAAAAVAGIIKMVQAIHHGVAPASLHIREPSPQIDWEGSGVELLSKARQWPSVNRPRRAAVSSFGIGGTNSHIILEQPEPVELEVLKPKNASAAFPWLISGANEAALRAQAHSLLAAWRQADDKASSSIRNQDPADIAYSLATARSALKYRATVTYALGANLHNQIQTTLESLAQGEPHPDVVTAHTSTTGNKPRLACLFSGQGSRMPSIGILEELRAIFPVFSRAFQAACDEVDRHLECPLVHAMGDSSLLDRTDFAQATLFVFEVAMFHLLESFNVRPDLVAGHSLGEIAAAHVAGALSLRDAATIVTARAKLMATLPPNGGMVSISATEEEVAEELPRSGGTAAIAAVNSHNSVVVSGTQEAIKAVADKFASLGRRATVLRNVKHGFHSPMMDGILSDLEKALVSSMEGEKMTTIPLISTITGKRADAAQLSSSKHWIRHVSEPVRFADAVNELKSNEHVSIFVEIGPSAVLSPHVPGAVATHGTVDKLLNTLGQLWARGVPVDWQAVFEGSGARLVDLPVYAFQRQRFWLPYTPLLPAASMGAVTAQPQEQNTGAFGSGLGHGMLFNATSIPGTSNIICSGYLSTTRQPWLRDHVIGGQSLVPATAFAELAMRAAQECSEYSEFELMILNELIVVAPLALSVAEDEEQGESEEFQIQVLIGELQLEDEDTETRRSVEVYSRPSGVATQHEWTHHATGTLKLTSLPNPGRDSFINGTDPTKAESEVDVSKAYAVLDDAGIRYGPSFQGVRAIWRLYDNDLLVQIDPPQNQGQKSAFVLHPAVLDAALHAPTLASPEKVASGEIRLPFSLRGIQVFEAVGTSGPILARIRHIGEDRFSLSLTNKSTGVMVAMVSEVQLRAWQPAVAGGDLYRLEWTESGSKSAQTTTPSTTDKIVWVQSSHNIDAAAVSKAVHEAVAEALRVVHEWRAEKAYAADGVRLVFVTERATSTGNNSHIDVVAAAVWGFIRSAQAEFGGDRIVLVDLDGSTESEEVLSSALASREEVVAVHGGKIMVPRLSRHAPITETPHPMTLDVSGTVLITGGTGGLGAILSRDIVHTHGVKSLLLISRSGIEAPGARELYDELRSANAAVRVEACDVGDRAQLAALLESRHQYPPITAVIHCAGVVDDAVLGSQTTERVSRVLRPKVDAAWNLHELVPDTVRSFVLFSSYVSVLGNEGQAAYSGGNAFLDALARFRVAQGLPALSLAWGPWANDAGMATERKLAALPPRIANAQPLTDQQGLHLFYKALQTQSKTPPEPVLLPLLLCGSFPLVPSTSTASKTKKTSAKGGSGSGAVWRRNIAAVSSEGRHDTLLGLVRDEIAAVLGYQGQDMLPDKPLADLGFDSFTSVMLTNRLRVLTGFSYLPVTLALDYDTSQALVEYLLPRIEAEPQPEVDLDSDASTTAENTPAAGDSGKENKLNTSSSATTLALEEQDDVNPEIFRGLATIHRRLSQLEQYTAAADLLASAALAMPTFPKVGSSLSGYAADPQRLATGPSGSSNSELPLPLVFIAPFFPRIKIGEVGLSVYSNLASAMNGERDVFELPHPEGQVVPEDLDTLAELHVSTIRKHFSDRPGIILAGYSAGGAVAYAVASKLAKAGDQPWLAGFVLVDTYLSMTGRGDPDWLNALPADALVSRLQGPSLGDPKSMGGESLVGDLDLALAKVGGYFRTLRDWDVELHPLPDELSTLFVRARDPSDKMPKNSNVWRPQWPRANFTVDVPGSHLALLDKRYAPAIAVEIQRWAREHVGLHT